MQKIQYDFTTKHRNGQALQLTGFLHEPGAHLLQQQWPILFFIPGGGLTHIEADVDDNIALAFYNHGFSTFYMDYRFRSDQQPLLPAPLVDVANGLQVIHDHAATWHLDNDKTVLAGFSIGGLLASLLADLPENQQFLSEHGLTGSTLKSQALILGYPVTDLTMGWPHTPAELPEIAADPALYVAKNWLTPQHVPTFIWNTVTDGAVPPLNALDYVTTLVKMDLPVEYHLFHHGPHGMALATKATARKPAHQEAHVAHWTGLAIEWLNALWPNSFSD